MPDYVVYGTAYWDAPWLTEHNLAHALAGKHRVLYVEPPVTPLTPLRYGLRRESLAGARRLLRRSLRPAGRLNTLQLVALPPVEHARARRASAPLLRWQVARAVDRLGLTDPVVLAARPMLELRGAASERASIFLVKDLLAAGGTLLGRESSRVVEEEQRMCEEADLVCVVTRRLQDRFAARGFPSVVLPHGFHAELAPLYDDAERPPEYGALPRPLLGYAGRIDDRLDFDALAALADRYRHGSIVLIGPFSPRLPQTRLDTLARHANVHLLGARSREELPAYLRHLDCCLMPYREDEWGKHGSPLKLWDALYAGAPVVGSGYVALLDHPLVHYASPPGRLPEVVASALDEAPDRADLRREYALRNTWDARAAELEALLADRLGIR